MSFELIQQNRCQGGYWKQFKHDSETCGCEMVFSVYVPEIATEVVRNLPGLFWLSGLTCSDRNFVDKAHVEARANDLGMIIVVPDTSPRGVNISGEDDSYDFGSAAGFYLDATESPWSDHYRMYSYITSELYELVLSRFPIDHQRLGIFGHSMGGHGALTIALKNPDKFRSVSAFAPICAPSQCPWGQKALMGYLGDNPPLWRQYDTCALIADGSRVESILIDQGLEDQFLEDQLMPEALEAVCAEKGIALTLNRREGYDHSYFFISSFIDEHLRYHYQQLNGS
ncbi:S-formylglutathione hydrolase [Hahella ganghwensis]|uniref:S-formylglutathione hydrolase n=1 Tax=Hahella ganghwensis TaxID=286420 RepID=UPI000363D36A|nr:S-formylglutathione hydrolase [Hahella ganghwensis]